MTNPAAAAHLAELDARYEGHLSALRQHAAAARTTLDGNLRDLAPRPPHPTTTWARHEIPSLDAEPLDPVLDAPLDAAPPVSGTVDDDGIPIWQDPAQ